MVDKEPEMQCASTKTANRSVMPVLSSETCDVEILENGNTIKNFINNKIEARGSVGNEEPFFVANLDRLLERHLKWLNNLPRVKPFFAVKCNNEPVVIRMLSALGTGFDCASKGELQRVLSLGVPPDKIIYAHTAKPQSHIKYACAHGVDLMTFDNEDELQKISQCHAKAKLVIRIAVDDSKSMHRLNIKFGARLDNVEKLLEQAGEVGLDVVGVSFHVGSGCTEGWAYKQAISDARHVFDIANLMGFQMRILDIGGGFSEYGDFHMKFQEVVEDSEQRYRSVIWGPTCDSSDKITENYWIPELEVGDWLLIDNIGAYSVSICTEFNGFEKGHIYPVVTADTWHTLNLRDTYCIIH
ncbi:hypothetical protein PAMP_009821 [Pampus punctatissimus]